MKSVICFFIFFFCCGKSRLISLTSRASAPYSYNSRRKSGSSLPWYECGVEWNSYIDGIWLENIILFPSFPICFLFHFKKRRNNKLKQLLLYPRNVNWIRFSFSASCLFPCFVVRYSFIGLVPRLLHHL